MHFAGACTTEAALHALLLLIICNGRSAEFKRLDRRLQAKTGELVADQPSGGTRRRSLCQRQCWHQSVPTACRLRSGCCPRDPSCHCAFLHVIFPILQLCFPGKMLYELCAHKQQKGASQAALQCRAKSGTALSHGISMRLGGTDLRL